MNRIAIKMDADTAVVSGVVELERHLDDLAADPTLEPRVKLFDDVELQMRGDNILPLIPRLLPKVDRLLKQFQQDPTVLCNLALKLLGPLSFMEILNQTTKEAIILALQSPAPSANILAMAILEKAAASPSDAAILATMKEVVANFLTCWLGSPDVGVGEKATKVLGNLLEMDCESRPPQGLVAGDITILPARAPGQGFIWRRLFRDHEIYGIILFLCSHDIKTGGNSGLPARQVSLAQGRLLRLLPLLAALNLAEVAQTSFPQLNEKYAGAAGNYGLLQFAALHMIVKEDELMYLNLLDFFDALFSSQRITEFSKYKMDTLRQLFEEAAQDDPVLRDHVVSSPERTIPEEADDLRLFIRQVTSTS